ncbi:MAG: MarR family winged helix-turn-helix transcriptional regulator, partial [Sarcina sp.]
MTTNENLKLSKNLSIFRKSYHLYLNERFKNTDLTVSEFNYMKELIVGDGLLQDKIIKNLAIDKAAASRIAQTLEKKNFIKRVKNETDKRNFNIFLTEEG